MKKRALITGLTGQDGSYLAEFLLAKNYEVYGLVRRVSTPNYVNIKHLLGDVTMIEGDLIDTGSLMEAVRKSKPDEIYNLGAQSFVGTSWKQEELTEEINSKGVKRILKAAQLFAPNAKFYQASTSEIFGNSHTNGIQNEQTPFKPRSPYAIAKLDAFWTTRNYRESYNMFACNGILFNHESERRGIEFVTRKITDAVAKMYHGKTNILRLGDIESKRDWGHAEDYVEAMWIILQQEKPEDFVIATGETHSVEEFIDKSFEAAGLNYAIADYSGLEQEEANRRIEALKKDRLTNYVIIDPKFFRPAELYELKGDSTKAKTQLGWKPKVTFDQLVERMVKSDINLLKK
ncbi:MAG: GDP-mannose 4,6-dehydratase [archaeon]